MVACSVPSSYVEGRTATVDGPMALFGELGAMVRRLHAIEVVQFTSRVGSRGFDRWREFLDHRWQAVLGRAAEAELDAGLVTRAHAFATSAAAEVDGAVRPSLCHRDLYLDNVLVDDAGALVAIIDFDSVEVWDPLVEWFSLEWFVFEPNPAARSAFMDGYLAGDPLPAMFDERVRLATIIELVNHAAGWRLTGQPEIAAEALDRLRVQLGLPAEH